MRMVVRRIFTGGWRKGQDLDGGSKLVRKKKRSVR